MSVSTALQVLYVEDEPAHAKLVERAFRRWSEPIDLIIATTYTSACQQLARQTPALVIADFLLPDGKGTDLVDIVRGACPVMVLTSHGNEATAVDALKRGASDYLVKGESTLLEMPQLATRAIREWKHVIARRQTQQILESVITALDASVVVLDHSGHVVLTNAKLSDARRGTAATPNLLPASVVPGADLMAVLRSGDVSPEVRQQLIPLFDALLSRLRTHFSIELGIPHHGDTQWFQLRARRLEGAGLAAVLIMTDDITARRHAERDQQQRAVSLAQLQMLSPRERDVIQRVAVGKANKSIAVELELSERTVEKHRASAMKKLNLRSVADVVRALIPATEA